MATKWTREHEQNRQEILDLLREDVQPFEDLSEPAKKARREQGLIAWGETYFPHYIKNKSSWIHREMARQVGEPGLPTAVGMFRGAGKSVWAALIRSVKRTLEGKCPYWLYGSRTQTLAAQRMDMISIELQNNERLAADYGECTVDGSEDEWVVTLPRRRARDGKYTYRKAKFEAFGIGISPRGRLFGAHRPLEFVGDDLMDNELARNTNRVQNLWDWLFDAVIPALEPSEYRMTILDTMYGGDCLLERFRKLAEKKDAEGRPLARRWLRPATDDEGHSVWPERFSDAELQRIRAMVGEKNWMRNYALSPDDPDAMFPPDGIVEYDTRDIDISQMHVVCYLDPAISEAPSGCPRACVAIGVYSDDPKRYILDARLSRGNGRDMCNWIFAFNETYHPVTFGVEQNGGYALIKDLLFTMRRGHEYVPIDWDTADEPKPIRIARLSTPWANGRWLWPKERNQHLQKGLDQFLAYKGDKDTGGWVDFIDACAGARQYLPNAFGTAGSSGFEAQIGGELNQAAYV